MVKRTCQNLIVRILGKFESWLNQGEGALSFEAQMTLSNTVYNVPTSNNICDQFSCKNEKYLLACYLFLLRSANGNDAILNEKQRMLSNLLCESEEFVKELENALTDNYIVINDINAKYDGDGGQL